MADTLARRVGRHLAKLRGAQGLRQIDVAGKSGVTRASLSLIENGRYAGLALDTMERICAALSLTVKEFFDSLPGA